jgi:quercetin dioxygenase-like cupin family protein
VTLAKGAQDTCWADLPVESVRPGVMRQRLDTQHMTVVRYQYKPEACFPSHSHPEEQVVLVLRGEIEFTVADLRARVAAGSVLVIPPFAVHSASVVGDSPVETVNVLSPRRTRGIEFPSQDKAARKQPREE